MFHNMYVEVVLSRPIIKPITPPNSTEAASHRVLAEPDIDAAENPLATSFDYHVPPQLRPEIEVGQLVAVPLRTEKLPAIVVAIKQTSLLDVTRPIFEILDPTPVVTPAQIELAHWLSAQYLTALATCLRAFLPPGSHHKSEYILKPNITPANRWRAESLAAPARLLFTFLQQKGGARWKEIDQNAARTLMATGLAQRESVLSKPKVGPKMDRTVELLIPPDQVEVVLPTVGRASKQADLLTYLVECDDPFPPLDEVLNAIGYKTESGVNSLTERGWLTVVPAENRLAIAPTMQSRLKEVLADETLSDSAKTLLTMLAQQPPQLESELLIQLAQLDKASPMENSTDAGKIPVTHTIEALIEQGLLGRFIEPTRVRLNLPPEQVLAAIITLRHAERHVSVLRLLASEDGPLWIGWVYAQTEANLKVLRDLESAKLISLDATRRWRDPLVDKIFTLENRPDLTPEQEHVWRKILQIWQASQRANHQRHQRQKPIAPTPILLHGVTGSGKTEIYMRAIDVALKAGQHALMLVPEITLAMQAVARVSARFPEQVALWHSALSPGERYDAWDRVRNRELSLVVGARSALFAPLQNLGVIVVDEEHDAAYKQMERPPLFHARHAAIELGRLTGALVILGSASPDVVSYHQAKLGNYKLMSLPKRVLAHVDHVNVQKRLIQNLAPKGRTVPFGRGADAAGLTSLPLPTVELIDLREELKAGNRTIFSRALQEAMYETLQRGEQVILFLNRRGNATFVNCRDCGYVQRCPHCDTTLTHHRQGELLICHYCGYRQLPFQICPECKNKRIRYFGLGTQRVEEAVRHNFPYATSIRWDQDVSRKRGSHDIFLQHFMSGRANIMVGTQMVTKGLDLPLVTLVGVISADTSLFLPDFRAAERTFQMLVQVAGRAGRSPLGGRVIIQSYNLEQPVIQAAARYDYLSFYNMEIKFRREQQYPPYKRLAVLLYSGAGEERAKAEAENMAEQLRRYMTRLGLPNVEIVGPTPHYVPRLRTQFRWFILVRATNPPELLRPLMPLPFGWKIDVDPVSIQ
ncbi:primosomal protein N' [Anaerolineales bacterium HSG24]|nr:primosomal protein N' [Anaerolineales bacterium HSG24]